VAVFLCVRSNARARKKPQSRATSSAASKVITDLQTYLGCQHRREQTLDGVVNHEVTMCLTTFAVTESRC